MSKRKLSFDDLNRINGAIDAIRLSLNDVMFRLPATMAVESNVIAKARNDLNLLRDFINDNI